MSENSMIPMSHLSHQLAAGSIAHPRLHHLAFLQLADLATALYFHVAEDVGEYPGREGQPITLGPAKPTGHGFQG